MGKLTSKGARKTRKWSNAPGNGPSVHLSHHAAFGFGGSKPVSSRHLRRWKARRHVEPGFPWEGQFVSREEVNAYLSHDKLQCLLCGKHYRGLGNHVSTLHGVTPEEYRERFGLRLRDGLVGVESKKLYGEAAINNPNLKDNWKKVQPLAANAPHRKGPEWVRKGRYINLGQRRGSGGASHLRTRSMLTDEQINELRSAKLSRGSISEFSKKFGVNDSVIRRAVKSIYGDSLDLVSGRSKFLNLEEMKALRPDKSYSEIARRYGISTMWAHRLINGEREVE